MENCAFPDSLFLGNENKKGMQKGNAELYIYQ